MVICQWCDKQFETDINYQIYCSSECRERSTKEKIAVRYMMGKRKNRIGKDRRCKSCNEKLSIYNDEELCVICNVNPKDVTKAIKNIKGYMNGKE